MAVQQVQSLTRAKVLLHLHMCQCQSGSNAVMIIHAHPCLIFYIDFSSGQVIRATFSLDLSRNTVALQVEKGCCPYYNFALNLSRNKFRCCKLWFIQKILRCDWSVVCFASANKVWIGLREGRGLYHQLVKELESGNIFA